jgi:hypothetical protein
MPRTGARRWLRRSPSPAAAEMMKLIVGRKLKELD